ncbi:hypothetical protein HYFRA_00000565 [Hymenoscyphus fraxineus]|uniref:Uncharacterized protein n=1 Tax=Hymenoscyphus fraxineus TaxID=746836 RepID=A0A9N9L743_9HELO|nr:hypothetical protein HYFRA_00000565 [Hymenoscyphus fraxineus]
MYQPLSQAPPTDCEADCFEERENASVPEKRNRSTIFRRWLHIVFTISIIANLATLMYLFHTPKEELNFERSEYEWNYNVSLAGLVRNVPKPWAMFNVANETEQEKLWDETNYDKGNIALDDDYAKAMGLPRAQRFPWDQSKGIYLINAYHNLHCVKTLRTAIVEFHFNSKQSSDYSHLIHCLNVLRDEIQCDASDTPRYTGYQPNQKSGLGQVRLCRDWRQLEAWALGKTACWKHIGDIRDPGFRELDRYRFCPPGSPYEEMAKTAWLHNDAQ